VQRRSLSELLLPQKSQNSNGFFGEKNEPNRFCFRFLFQRKKSSLFLFLQLWNHQLERERQSMMMILIYWKKKKKQKKKKKKKKKKKQRPKVETISHRTAAATTDCNSSGCQEERRICDCQKQ
jgi:hypothetical protein